MRLTRILHSLNPFSAVISNELRIASRRRRNYFVRVLYLGSLLLVLFADNGSTASQPVSASQLVLWRNSAAQEFFGTFAIFSLVAMAVVAPILTSTAISGERQRKTLPALMMTPIGTGRIIFGKLFSRLLGAFVLLGLSLPVLAIVRLLGSIELSQMCAVMALAAAAAVVAGSVGLMFSTFANRTSTIIILSFGFLGILYLLFPVIVILYLERARVGFGAERQFDEFFSLIHPLMGIITVVESNPIPGALHWYWCLAFQLIPTSIFVAVTAARLRRASPGSDSQGAALAVIEGEPPGIAPASAASSPRPLQGAGGTPRTVGDHPVLWHEMRIPLFPRLWLRIAAGIGAVALLAIVYGAKDFSPSTGMQAGVASILCGCIWFIAAVLSATTIGQEQERDSWTVLLATPLSARDIVLGKVVGVLRRMIGPTLIVFANFAFFPLNSGLGGVLVVVWVIISFNAVWIATGILLSLLFRKTHTAIICNLLLAVTLYAGMDYILSAIDGAAYRSGYGDPFKYEYAIGFITPYYYTFKIAGLDWPQYPGGLNYLYFQDVTLDWILWGGFITGLAYLGVAISILVFTICNFDRIVNRTPQLQPLARGGRDPSPPVENAPAGGVG